MKLTGAEIVVKTLIRHGVTDCFGFPGGSVLGLYDELYRHQGEILHYCTSHEQGAAHAADGYARVTGKTGVVLATSGPGATNLVTGLAAAYLDSVPLVAITGNVPVPLIGKDSFQEVDITGVTMPITKHNYIVSRVEDLEPALREAFQIARSGRPGPVLVDIPKDIQAAECEFLGGEPLPAEPMPAVDAEAVKHAAELIRRSERPFIYAGGGVILADASRQLVEFAEKIDAPVGFSMMGLSAMDARSPRFLGMTGMHGTFAASMTMAEADLIIGVGVRFSDRATGNRSKFQSGARILHIDIDPAELGKNITSYTGLVGNLREILPMLCGELEQQNHSRWMRIASGYRSDPAGSYGADEKDGALSPQAVIDCVRKHASDDTPVATDVGQHQMWVAQRYPFAKPRTFLTSGGLGAMGYGMGAAIGAAVGSGFRRTVLFTGDGSFHMNLNELATAAAYNIPLVVVIMNNGVLGMVRQWQSLFFDRRYSHTNLSQKTDFVRLAESFGAGGFRARDQKSLEHAVEMAFIAAGPVVIDCVIDKDEKVLPMIPPNGSVEDIILR